MVVIIPKSSDLFPTEGREINAPSLALLGPASNESSGGSSNATDDAEGEIPPFHPLRFVKGCANLHKCNIKL